MSLYHKYRPKTLDEVVGNETTILALSGDLNKKEKPHAFLLSGPTGCGKTTLGRIIATVLECKDSNFREMDSADFRGIDTIRYIREQSMYKPIGGTCQVWLLDECHKLTNDAQHALLKTLEDSPPHVYYVLATTDPHKLIPTILGRCAQYNVAPLGDNLMYKLLRRIVREEKEELTKEIYDQIIRDSEGHPRNALQILDQVLAVPSENRLKAAKKVHESVTETIELCRMLVNKASWNKVAQTLVGLKDKNEDVEKVRRAVLGYCQSIILKGQNHQAVFIMDEFMEPFYNSGFPQLTYACYKVVHG